MHCQSLQQHKIKARSGYLLQKTVHYVLAHCLYILLQKFHSIRTAFSIKIMKEIKTLKWRIKGQSHRIHHATAWSNDLLSALLKYRLIKVIQSFVCAARVNLTIDN